MSEGVRDASQRLTYSWALAEFLPAWWPPNHGPVTAGMVMFPWGARVTTQTSSFNFSGLCLFYFPSIKKRITHLVRNFYECIKCHQIVNLEKVGFISVKKTVWLSWLSTWPACRKRGVQFPARYKLGIVVYTYDSNTWQLLEGNPKFKSSKLSLVTD